MQYNENLAYGEKIDKPSRVPLDCPSVCSAFLPFSVLRQVLANFINKIDHLLLILSKNTVMISYKLTANIPYLNQPGTGLVFGLFGHFLESKQSLMAPVHKKSS